jgi:predicted PurR-regulated permease PerM
VILVVLFTMPIRFLTRRGMRRAPAIILSLLFITILVVGLAATALPELFTQFRVLATVIIPQGIQTLVDRYLTNGELVNQFPFLQDVDLESLLNTLSGQLAAAIGQLSVSVLPVLGGVADTLLSILIVIFLSIYLLADPQMHQEGVIRFFPIWYRYRVREIFARLDYTLRGWLRATIISMAFVGVATWLGLSMLGIQQAAALGVLAGLLSFIPNFGPIIALIPSIAVGILQTPESIGWIVVIIYGVSFVQSQIFTPLLVAGSIKLPPVLVLLGQIIAGAFLGFLGIMLAVPITAILSVLVQEVYIKDILGDASVSESQVAEEVLIPDRV